MEVQPKITLTGELVMASDGTQIPHTIRREYRTGKGTMANSIAIDIIRISKITNTYFTIWVKEEDGGAQGGGIMGDLIDKFSKENYDKKSQIAASYDSITEEDIYRVDIRVLDWLWKEYRKATGIGKEEITIAQAEARSANMAKARQKRAEQNKYKKTHF